MEKQNKKTIRATLVNVIIGDTQTSYVVANKEAGQRLLYVLAVENWVERMGDVQSKQLPTNRKAVLTAFYGAQTGNSFTVGSCMSVSQTSMTERQKRADSKISRNKAKVSA